MFLAVSPDQITIPPGAVLKIQGSWKDYKELQHRIGERSAIRIKYHSGEIWLMNPLPEHGRSSSLIADIVKTLLGHLGKNYEAFIPITIDLPEIAGIEPDYCFYIDLWQAVVGKSRLNWEIDPPPDLVIEVDVTSFTNVGDYLPYSIPEVWLYKESRLKIYRMRGQEYEEQSQSLYFPDMDVIAVVESCCASASTQGSGAAIQQLMRSLYRQ